MKYSNIIYKYKKITPLGCKDIDILRGRFAKNFCKTKVKIRKKSLAVF